MARPPRRAPTQQNDRLSPKFVPGFPVQLPDNLPAARSYVFPDTGRMTCTPAPGNPESFRSPKSARGGADCCSPLSFRDFRIFVPTESPADWKAGKIPRSTYRQPVEYPDRSCAPASGRAAEKNRPPCICLFRSGPAAILFLCTRPPAYRVLAPQNHCRKQTSPCTEDCALLLPAHFQGRGSIVSRKVRLDRLAPLPPGLATAAPPAAETAAPIPRSTDLNAGADATSYPN